MSDEEIRNFAEGFAYNFVQGMSTEKEFENLTGKDMQGIVKYMRNALNIKLQSFFAKKGGKE